MCIACARALARGLFGATVSPEASLVDTDSLLGSMDISSPRATLVVPAERELEILPQAAISTPQASSNSK